jgi:integrase
MAASRQPSTIRSYYGTARSLFGDAVEMDIIGRSPCRGIKLPAAKAAEKKVIEPVELHKLADAVGPRWRAFVYLGGAMGLRFGEIAALRLMDLDLDTGQLAVTRAISEVAGQLTFGPPKTAAGIRTLVAPAPIVDELGKHIRAERIESPEDLLFTDVEGGPVRRSNFRNRVFAPAVTACGLDGLTFHGLRHSAATLWIAEGIDARTVQHLLGHTDPRLVLRLYAHAADEAMRKAADITAATFWRP